ncbi:thymidylate synthase [Natronobacterium gregoryi]|uniref:Thymidylate synthase n=2 Tax=Natronobacterium gregoryi TaxID=44930 RepID=L0AM00_NATGS|nr:thymidylate synthase [Natronobacterium gregoryi]AFZ74484.1 thymidylate synthase [Natronobacterium gregoryi SP2]ELY72446.1 thymidylate synthase [Natronobacterium gregoryi SP2]PLK21769.1 thymidylate synthase [Natronobacterium gregoryi SP2]SFJ45520.1 thymidylate synthase [Natronobacterium gregoryi]
MQQYLELVDSALSGGTYKPNRTGVDTISSFSEHYEVDIKDGYPLLTTKQMDGYRWNSMLHEVCWYLSGEEHVRNLREETKIWDAWADEEGRLDTAYGRFWRRYPVPDEGVQLAGESWPDDGQQWVTVEETDDGESRRVFDQLQYVVDTLSDSPNSRRLVVNAWHPANAAVSTLPPCHYTFVFNVQGDRLNCHLTQRSGDIALGVPFNIAAYALLTKVVAQQTGFESGTFAHTVVDAHVYCGRGDRGEWYDDNLEALQSRLAEADDREDYLSVKEWLESEAPPEAEGDERLDHVPGLLEQLSRDPLERPTLEVADASIDDLTYEDVSLQGYESHEGIQFSVAE